VDEITTQDHRFFLMGMDLKNGEVVFTQQFHSKSRLTTPMSVDVEQQQAVAPPPFAPDDPFANPPVLCGNGGCDEVALHFCKRCSMKLCARYFRKKGGHGLCDACSHVDECASHVSGLGRMSR
jgi:hypothetical protein